MGPCFLLGKEVANLVFTQCNIFAGRTSAFFLTYNNNRPYAKVFILGGRDKRECGIGARGLFVCSGSLGLVSSVTYLRGIPAPSAFPSLNF